jgi:hypothetical protein
LKYSVALSVSYFTHYCRELIDHTYQRVKGSSPGFGVLATLLLSVGTTLKLEQKFGVNSPKAMTPNGIENDVGGAP